MTNNTDAVVQFGELPPDRRGSARNREVAEALRGRPGEWAKIATKNSTNATSGYISNLRAGRNLAFRPIEHFEMVRRGNDVWARFVGDPS